MMAGRSRLAVIAALEREFAPLLRGWPACERDYAGRRYRFFERAQVVVVCGGIGREAAGRAAEAVVAFYQPGVLVSAGFAGALRPELQVGQLLTVRKLIDASDGSWRDLKQGEGTLITVGELAGAEQKRRLAEAYGADAVDMEAAAVALAAERHQLRFAAFKAISDQRDFELPALERFIGPTGGLDSLGLSAYVGLRPWLWPRLAAFARASGKASRALCAWLEPYSRSADGPAEFPAAALPGALLEER